MKSSRLWHSFYEIKQLLRMLPCNSLRLLTHSLTNTGEDFILAQKYFYYFLFIMFKMSINYILAFNKLYKEMIFVLFYNLLNYHHINYHRIDYYHINYYYIGYDYIHYDCIDYDSKILNKGV